MSTNFINRERELAMLSQALGSDQAELILLYGRRGVGKSALLEAALETHSGPLVYYRATRRTLPLQLATLTDAVREAMPQAFLAHDFASTSDMLGFLAHHAEPTLTPVTLVIDELPYLAEVDQGLLTVLQHWWDANKRQANLKVVLAGSYVGFMERQALDIRAPLYHRRTRSLLLKPLDYAEAARFFPNWSAEDRMLAYAVLGGMPIYLEQFNATRSLEENIRATILKAHTFLAEEPDWLLLEDLRRDILYGSILRAIAGGARKPSDIARAVGKASAQDIFPRLTTLIDLGLVVRVVPITERTLPRTRNSQYWVADPYLDFWYRFVDPARALLDRGMGERIWERRIQPGLAEYAARPSFERACRQYVWRALSANRIDRDIVEVGTWWSGAAELDVVAQDAGGQVTLIGSCKWTSRPLEVRHYAELLSQAQSCDLPQRDPLLVLFSRAGFDPRLAELAKASDQLLLVDLPAMYGV